MRLLIILGLALSATPAAAQDMPARKAGLWEMTMTFEGRGAPPQDLWSKCAYQRKIPM